MGSKPTKNKKLNEHNFSNPFNEEILLEILTFIQNMKFILNCRLVCKEWNYIINSSKIWNYYKINVQKLNKLTFLKNALKRLEFKETTDKDFKYITKFTKLQELDCKFYYKLSKKSLQCLTGLTNLEILKFNEYVNAK